VSVGGSFHADSLPKNPTYQDCVTCHKAGGSGSASSLRKSLHPVHMKSSHFEGLENGTRPTCFACHKIQNVSVGMPSYTPPASGTPSELPPVATFSLKDVDEQKPGMACADCHTDEYPNKTDPGPGERYNLLYEAVSVGGSFHADSLPKNPTYQDCVTCHKADGSGSASSLRTSLHPVHMKSSHFEGLENGTRPTCFACHEVTNVSKGMPSYTEEAAHAASMTAPMPQVATFSLKDVDSQKPGKACADCHTDEYPNETDPGPGERYNLLYEAVSVGGSFHADPLPKNPTYQDCVACHKADGSGTASSLRTSLHPVHMKSSHFEGLENGTRPTCFACHLVTNVSKGMPSYTGSGS
ncbi:MAG: hypothetical protein ABEJ58_10435, partial [Halodesulfurarchaeum sp.]